MGDRKPGHPSPPPPHLRGIYSPRLHLTLYSLLLVFTPFLMLRNFLQTAIGDISLSTFHLGGLAVPLVPTLAAAAVVLLLVIFRPRITKRRVLAALFSVAMVALAQRITDFYFGHRFYELQQNWHYFAYAIFTLMSYRYLRFRGVSLARLVLITFGLAVVYSAFDEGFQLLITSRIFDPSDIAKDAWGALTGLTFLLIAGEYPELAQGKWKRIRQRTVAEYFHQTASVWVLLFVLGLLFLGYASLLTESQYLGAILLFTLGTFVVFFAVLHLSQFRWWGRALLALAVLAVLTQGYFYLRHRNDYIIRQQYGLMIYKGIPVPFFDVMIFPDSHFRLVDKKHYFNSRDRRFFNRQRPDVLIIGAGYRGKGGQGFPQQWGSRFIYNPFTERGTQVIILNSSQACERFNQLKKQGKNVLLVLHNTC